MADMTELEIQNFALDFSNLINRKNGQIAALKTENAKLAAIASGYIKAGRKLTEDEIRAAKRPVFVYHKERYATKKGFWAVPLEDRIGVISARKGMYRYDDYGRTWVAFPDEPAPEEGEQL